MLDQTKVSVAGAGFAEMPIPMSLRLARLSFSAGVFGLAFGVIFLVNGWSWVTRAGADGFTEATAFWAALSVTASALAAILVSKTGMPDRLFGIRRSSRDGRRVFGGFRGRAKPAAAWLVSTMLFASVGACIVESVRTCPLPELLVKQRHDVAAPAPDEGLVPIYFWDYATWVSPAWLENLNLVLPYEKGPPQRYLPKIYLEDARTRTIALELHGRRPRQYQQKQLYEIFDTPMVQPRDWPLLWRLEREAGLTTAGLTAPVLHLMRIAQGGSSKVTQAIGVPWNAQGKTARPEDGHFFFWGPDGSVFQVKCPAPCPISRMLELVQFPDDPKGSRAERLEWTKTTLKRLLDGTAAKPADELEALRQNNLLSLYLVSLLTQDPRDPEAYFHLGKLARNRETALSALRYGRDVGLEHAKLVELEAVVDRF